MKEIKNINKFKKTLQLCNYFIHLEKPEIIISFIYRNIYELISESKYIPHTHQFESFPHDYRAYYKEYYAQVIMPSNDHWLYFLFPDPAEVKWFSFKKFYTGLSVKLQFSYTDEYCYSDPLNWAIGYKFDLYHNKLRIKVCQYILIENYNDFQVEEEIGNEQIADYYFVLFNDINKYPGQPYEDCIVAEKGLNAEYYKVQCREDQINRMIEKSKADFYKRYDPRIWEACKKIMDARPNSHMRRYDYVSTPLHFYKEELAKELEPILISKRDSDY